MGNKHVLCKSLIDFAQIFINLKKKCLEPDYQ